MLLSRNIHEKKTTAPSNVVADPLHAKLIKRPNPALASSQNRGTLDTHFYAIEAHTHRRKHRKLCGHTCLENTRAKFLRVIQYAGDSLRYCITLSCTHSAFALLACCWRRYRPTLILQNISDYKKQNKAEAESKRGLCKRVTTTKDAE